jgi:16S rRNA (adenine1518-N6/adenine1519-N6)-dimethyltransferase
MKPKKSLGQNFLKDTVVLAKIIKAADLKADDFVIEIGPGEGVLTQELSNRVSKLITIEKDERLAEQLAQNFKFSIYNSPAGEAGLQSIFNDPVLNFKNKTAIISGDVLKVNLPELINKNSFHNYKVIANIPYYITSPIIQLFLETKYPPKEMILMVQKEVAERICAIPGNMSILALSVQYYAKSELLFHVSKTAFYPVPKVNSAVIRITHNLKNIPKDEAKKFFRVVRSGFCAKRKKLANNLSSSFHLDKKLVEEKLKEAGVIPASRAQELSAEDWKKLSVLF